MKWVFAVAASVIPVLALASEPTPAGPAAPLSVLIDRLGSESYADREAAFAAIERHGAAAIPALEAARLSENPEVRERAVVLLVRLKRAAESTTRLKPPLIKLDYRDLPLGTAVNDLRQRSKLPLVLDATHVANPLRKITCTTEELPVWEALEAFCRAAGLCELFANHLEVPRPPGGHRGGFVAPPNPSADSIAIILADGKPQRLPGARATAVRVIAIPPEFSGHKVSLGTGEYTFCLDVTPAAGLHWQEVLAVKVSRVVDAAGRSGSAGIERSPLPAFDPTGTVMFARPGVAVRFDRNGNPILPESIPNPRVVPVPLKIATASARSLKRLEGAVHGEVNVMNQQLVTITDIRASTGKKIEGPNELKVTVMEVKDPTGPSGPGLVRVQVESPAPWVAASRRRGLNPGFNPGWPEPPAPPGNAKSVQLYDAAGKLVPATQSGYLDMSDDGMVNIHNLHFTFRSGAGNPTRLAVIGPKSVFVEVPFVMENVALP